MKITMALFGAALFGALIGFLSLINTARADIYYTIGDMTYGSDGSVYQTYNNTTYGYLSNGQTVMCNTYDNITVCQ